MAAVALLHPQDAFNHLPAGRRFVNTATPSTSSLAGRRSPPSKRRKGSPTKKDAAPVNPKPRSTPKPTTPPGNTGNLVMGQVKILKRGETMPAQAPVPEKVNKVAENVIVSHRSLEGVAPAKAPLVSHKSLEKAGPAKARKYMNAFAGSAVTSPEPNCLPVPAFCSKKGDMSGVVDPTNNLVKLLRLNLCPSDL